MNLESTGFYFIGPDRDLIEYQDIKNVCRLAEIIQYNGLPNYKMVRYPIRSGVNLPASEDYLQDYPDQRLVQYLTFGFPLGPIAPDMLHNTDVTNHFLKLEKQNPWELFQVQFLRLNFQIFTAHQSKGPV